MTDTVEAVEIKTPEVVADVEAKPARGRPAKAKLLPVKLLKNYRPTGSFKAVDLTEAPLPGVGFANKIWAGSVIKLPADEAKGIVANGIADRADTFGED